MNLKQDYQGELYNVDLYAELLIKSDVSLFIPIGGNTSLSWEVRVTGEGGFINRNINLDFRKDIEERVTNALPQYIIRFNDQGYFTATLKS